MALPPQTRVPSQYLREHHAAIERLLQPPVDAVFGASAAGAARVRSLSSSSSSSSASSSSSSSSSGSASSSSSASASSRRRADTESDCSRRPARFGVERTEQAPPFKVVDLVPALRAEDSGAAQQLRLQRRRERRQRRRRATSGGGFGVVAAAAAAAAAAGPAVPGSGALGNVFRLEELQQLCVLCSTLEELPLDVPYYALMYCSDGRPSVTISELRHVLEPVGTGRYQWAFNSTLKSRSRTCAGVSFVLRQRDAKFHLTKLHIWTYVDAIDPAVRENFGSLGMAQLANAPCSRALFYFVRGITALPSRPLTRGLLQPRAAPRSGSDPTAVAVALGGVAGAPGIGGSIVVGARIGGTGTHRNGALARRVAPFDVDSSMSSDEGNSGVGGGGGGGADESALGVAVPLDHSVTLPSSLSASSANAPLEAAVFDGERSLRLQSPSNQLTVTPQPSDADDVVSSVPPFQQDGDLVQNETGRRYQAVERFSNDYVAAMLPDTFGGELERSVRAFDASGSST